MPYGIYELLHVVEHQKCTYPTVCVLLFQNSEMIKTIDSLYDGYFLLRLWLELDKPDLGQGISENHAHPSSFPPPRLELTPPPRDTFRIQLQHEAISEQLIRGHGLAAVFRYVQRRRPVAIIREGQSEGRCRGTRNAAEALVGISRYQPLHRLLRDVVPVAVGEELCVAASS